MYFNCKSIATSKILKSERSISSVNMNFQKIKNQDINFKCKINFSTSKIEGKFQVYLQWKYTSCVNQDPRLRYTCNICLSL